MGKCLKKLETLSKSGAGASKTPSCKHFEALLFLKDTLVSRNPESNLMEQPFMSPPPSPRFPSTKNSFHSQLTEFDVACPSPPNSSVPTPKRQRSEKAKCAEERRDKIDLMLVEALQKPSTSNMEKNVDPNDNGDLLFCQSLVPSLRALPAKKNRLAKIDIQKVLLKYEFGDDDDF